MSRIIQPFGQVIKRITIEQDANGLLKCVAVNIAPAGIAEVAMTPLEALFLMTKFTSDMLGLMHRNTSKAGSLLGVDGGRNEEKTD